MQQTMQLTVDTGAVLIELKDKKGRVIGEVDFVPTDTDILKRYRKVIDYFNGTNLADIPEDKMEETMIQFSEDIRGQFDYLFNAPVSDGIFAKCGPLTVIATGDFFFENVIEGLGGLISTTFNERIEKKLKKIKKATAKYHK